MDHNSLQTLNEFDQTAISYSTQCDVEDLTNIKLVHKGDFTVVTQNIRSIYNNFDDFQITLSQFNFCIDILILTECRLNSTKEVPRLANYNVFTTSHHLNQNDGVVIYVKKSLRVNMKEIRLEHASCLQLNMDETIILGIYRSPSNPNAINFINSLNYHLETIKLHKNIIITGDININIINKLNENSYEYNNRYNYLLMLSTHGLLPGHCLPTRGDNCLDHFILKLSKNKYSPYVAVINSSITDHATIFLKLSLLSNIRRCPKTKTYTDFNMALSILIEKNLPSLLNCEDPNLLIKLLISKITDSLKESSYVKHISNKNRTIKPWMTPGILRCIRNRNNMQKKVKSNPDNEILLITYKRYRTHCNNLIKKVKRRYDRDQLLSSTKNIKKLWHKIKTIAPLKASKTNNDGLLSIKPTPIDSVNFVNSYFANIGKQLAENILLNFPNANKPPSYIKSTLFSFVLLETDTNEIKSVINNLKSDSAPGWDNIPTTFLKLATHILTPIICHLVNLCFKIGTFPYLLKQSIITPVYKGGDYSNTSNYRPISVLPAIAKIIEKILNSRILGYMEKFKIISSSQYGFRRHKNTEDAILSLTSHITEVLDKGQKCLTVFLDLKKAFDTVSVPILLQKLENIGIRGTALSLFKDYLSNRKQRVKIGDYMSSDSSVSFGVPQGSVLGPTLFLVYINDLLSQKIDDGRIFAYADDTAIVFSGSSWDAVKRSAEKGLANIYFWLKSNLLTINIDKTNYMCFTINNKTQPENDFKIELHNCLYDSSNLCNCAPSTLNRVSTIKYLGVMLDHRLSWHPHIDFASSRIRKLIWIFKILRHVTTKKLLIQIYLALAQSILGYCISVWGGASKMKFLQLERAQRSLLKVMFFKPFRFSTERIYNYCELLTVRKLYILQSTLKVHRVTTFSSNSNQHNKRRNVTAYIPPMRTKFGNSQFTNKSRFLYNKINKKMNINPLCIYQFKKILTAWLLSLNYDAVETLMDLNT